MDELTTLIGTLSEKLGVAASELYTVLQNQARLCAIKNSVWCIVYAAVIILSFVFLKKVFVDQTHTSSSGEKVTLCDYYDQEEDGTSVLLFAAGGVLIAVSIVSFVVLVETLYETIACIFNPKFWALSQLLSGLR